MAIPTRSEVKTAFLALVDDPYAASFDDAVFQAGYRQAVDALFTAMLNHQCPRIQTISTYTLPVNTTVLTPATAGLSNFADLDELEERLDGSTEKYTSITQVGKLTQRDAGDKLLEFVYRLDSFYFIGATTPRQLRITSESSGVAPTNDSTSVGVDGCEEFLANFAVGKAGRRKGYDEIAAECMEFAVGPRYSQGQIGGELWRLISAKVRQMQHVQLQQRRYSSTNEVFRRRVPYIMAQQPSGVGTAPAQFSTVNGTITGTMDGTNASFYLAYPVATANVYRNGSRMTSGLDYTFGANLITFIGDQIPVPGDTITVDGWLS